VPSLVNGFIVTQGPISTLSVSPGSGQQGQTLATVVIIAQNTAFVNGTTVADFGAGITVNSLTVNNAYKATANITVQSGATIGGRTVTLTTGTQVVSKTNAFTVTLAPASITSVTPNSGQQGETLASVAIAGQNTNFVPGTTVGDFGPGITINTLTVNSAASATANITVANNSTLGFRTVKLTTGTEVASLVNAFTVTLPPASITSVTPNSGQQGQTLTSVAIIGQNTNFVPGTTVGDFGTGVTINNLTVNGATSATANITIQLGAFLGSRTITMTTGTEVAKLTNGFTVDPMTGLVTWLRSDGEVIYDALNRRVSQWTDQTSNHFDASQANVIKQPLFVPNSFNGQPGIRFDGNDDQFFLNRPVQDDFTVFVVFKSTQGVGTSVRWYEGAGLLDGEVAGFQNDFGLTLIVMGEFFLVPAILTFTSIPFHNSTTEMFTSPRCEEIVLLET
jgi:hypothetical protein